MFRTPSRLSFRPRVECLEDRTTPSTTVLTVAPNPGTAGHPITLTAVITMSDLDSLQPGTGLPPGSVTFFDGSSSLGSVTVTGASTNDLQAAPN
jgi:hypothetical protein